MAVDPSTHTSPPRGRRSCAVAWVRSEAIGAVSSLTVIPVFSWKALSTEAS
jgi:hypothetical protein